MIVNTEYDINDIVYYIKINPDKPHVFTVKQGVVSEILIRSTQPTEKPIIKYLLNNRSSAISEDELFLSLYHIKQHLIQYFDDVVDCIAGDMACDKSKLEKTIYINIPYFKTEK